MSGRILCLLLAVVLCGALPAWAEPAAETVCIQCHGGLPGHLGAPVKNWQGSVHQRNGISCHDCHGGDPTDFANAMSPERGFIGAPDYEKVPAFCGRCHVGVLADYQESAHGRKVAEGGAQCVVCHGNHAVSEASLDLINERDCARCHDYGRAAQIREALAETDARFAKVSTDLERLKRLGLSIDSLKGRLFDLRNRYHRVFHSVEVERVRRETGGVQAELAVMQEEIGNRDRQMDRRKIWGGIATGLMVLLGVVMLQIRHTYAEEENRQ